MKEDHPYSIVLNAGEHYHDPEGHPCTFTLTHEHVLVGGTKMPYRKMYNVRLDNKGFVCFGFGNQHYKVGFAQGAELAHEFKDIFLKTIETDSFYEPIKRELPPGLNAIAFCLSIFAIIVFMLSMPGSAKLVEKLTGSREAGVLGMLPVLILDNVYYMTGLRIT